MLAEPGVVTRFYHIWGLRSFRLRESSGLAVPVAERLNEALSHGDLRPLGVWGFTLIVPGVPDTTKMRVPNDVLAILGTSDALVSEEHGGLVDAALAYAADYNTQLRSRRGE